MQIFQTYFQLIKLPKLIDFGAPFGRHQPSELLLVKAPPQVYALPLDFSLSDLFNPDLGVLPLPCGGFYRQNNTVFVYF